MRKNGIRKAARRQSGFTLIEVLVALAIAGLGLGLFIAATQTGIGNAGLADQYIEATRRSQSHLAEIGATIPLKPGHYAGDDGEGFSWRVQIAPLQSHEQNAGENTAALRLYAVAVRESWRSGPQWKSVTLQSERVGPP